MTRSPFLLLVAGLLALTASLQADDPSNARAPKSDADLRAWLENMVWYHHFTTEEIQAATGLSPEAIRAAQEKFNITEGNRPESKSTNLVMLPYPGGRHPRIGFLEGAVNPQRETKVSVFTPWDPASYVVTDLPEAIWWNRDAPETKDRGGRELLYLAHTHIDTLWSRQGITLERLEWEPQPDGSLRMERKLPNGVTFGTSVKALPDHVAMSQWLVNGTDRRLTGLKVQNCIMLKGATGFNEQTNANKVFQLPYAVAKSADGSRWIISAWDPCQRAWGNVQCPCLHSDPQFPDCDPGETVRLKGWLSFYEGTDIEGELKRIEETGWRTR